MPYEGACDMEVELAMARARKDTACGRDEGGPLAKMNGQCVAEFAPP